MIRLDGMYVRYMIMPLGSRIDYGVTVEKFGINKVARFMIVT